MSAELHGLENDTALCDQQALSTSGQKSCFTVFALVVVAAAAVGWRQFPAAAALLLPFHPPGTPAYNEA
jgi:hypothetical protein